MFSPTVNLVKGLDEEIELGVFHLNFSREVVTGTLTVPVNQQMTIHGRIDINAELILDGNLVLES